MNILSKIYDKLLIKQWNIGLARIDIKTIIRTKAFNAEFTWLPENDPERFFADPFIFKNNNGTINIIYEDFSNSDHYGKISIKTLNQNFEVIATNEILDTKSHLSYPNVFFENDTTYIMPEASLSNNLTMYEYDYKNKALINAKVIVSGLPLLDSTILKYGEKYWLFATKRGDDSNSALYIYYADKFDGPYKSHIKNPVKKSLNGSRPAGNFIEVDGEIYRPTQNSAEYYGKSITINKLKCLSEENFEEEEYFIVEAPKKTKYNYATHTINFTDDVIVIDALRRYFMPLAQIKIFIKKIFKKQ
ncbi:MAG: hypothetical protein JSU03_05645 [Bacteroidetes bacterium]|nr:hypothetical protein [Bacteroidota bacterium]MBS1756742.1 hypothetical protein [Bacteroidota bacterium]